MRSKELVQAYIFFTFIYFNIFAKVVITKAEVIFNYLLFICDYNLLLFDWIQFYFELKILNN